jgi:hypothetical protein
VAIADSSGDSCFFALVLSQIHMGILEQREEESQACKDWDSCTSLIFIDSFHFPFKH